MVFPQEPLERDRSRRTMKVRGDHRCNLLSILLHAKSMSWISIGHKAPIHNETLRVNLKHLKKTQIESSTPVHRRMAPAWQELLRRLSNVWSGCGHRSGLIEADSCPRSLMVVCGSGPSHSDALDAHAQVGVFLILGLDRLPLRRRSHQFDNPTR